MEQSKNNGYGVAALVLGIIGMVTSCIVIGIIPCLIGLVFGILGITQKNKTKGTAIAGTVCSGIGIFIFAFFLLISSFDTETTENSNSEIPNTEQKIEVSEMDSKQENKENEEQIEAIQDTLNSSVSKNVSELVDEEIKPDFYSVGDTFDADKLMVTINEANTNFTDYDDPYGWNTPNEGMKYIMVSFTFENQGKSDKYVSIYDFDCYADGTLCEQVYSFGGDFINANISSGRNVSFTTYYTVPINSSEIELEYEVSAWTSEKILIKL